MKHNKFIPSQQWVYKWASTMLFTQDQRIINLPHAIEYYYNFILCQESTSLLNIYFKYFTFETFFYNFTISNSKKFIKYYTILFIFGIH